MSERAARERVCVRVPASSANLGPGFDVLAAALALHLDVEVAPAGAFAVVSELGISRGRDNLVVRAFERLHPADGLEFRIASTIPLSGGLGSSAAAVVGGLLAAAALAGEPADVLALATELEGHPDNAAAALRGGIVICDGARVHRFDPPDGLEALLVVPREAVVTAAARAALPAALPLADVSANLASVATLVLGLARGDWELIAAGLRDRVHQPYRGHLYPRSAELLERAAELGALGATVSGAGPAVLVWTRSADRGRVQAALEGLVRGWACVIPAPFESEGAHVLTLP